MDLPRPTRRTERDTMTPDLLAKYRPKIPPAPRVTLFSYLLTAFRTKREWLRRQRETVGRHREALGRHHHLA